jgi:hypothetical protein
MADEESGGRDVSPRERRRQRAREHGGKGNAAATFRRYRVHLALVVIFGGVTTVLAMQADDTDACPGHWHSTVDVYVLGERVSFDHPQYTLEGSDRMPFSSHLHRGKDWEWHWEPQGGEDCIPLGEGLDYVDMEVSGTRLVLDGTHDQLGQSGTYTEEGNNTVFAIHRVGEGEWDTIGIGSLNDRQLKPDERVIILYGNYTDEQMAGYKELADGRTIQGSSEGKGSFVPAVGVAIIGLIVLAGWHALSKKAA